MIPVIIRFARPWVLAAGSAAASYLLLKKSSNDKKRLREAKLESLEQQRTINRLRHELGALKAKAEDNKDTKED